ncbi:methylated-DNA--[protein]-cysteine S-methyltransferase [Hymenobacter psoromatis]|uniref:methylated-DNA--[protein]-cysteine S-methyltransferase n=1 Tax=Hymenobacter psoromatis TaxID=1484116 RepID=UPI001CBCF662|nr:methylated-DNA--[protein]-cysteine S-methyltransferase [Hymenobacter psoromatis]
MQAIAHLYSPIGMLALRGSDAGLHAVGFVDREAPAPTPPAAVAACLQAPYQQLKAYFGRELREFDLPCAPLGGTDFQRRVWAALAGIGHGRTASYLDVAQLLNNPKSVRAVGAANGQNPLAIVWPCHRVVGADGALTGYAGGLLRKRWLLDFERPERQGALFG